MSASITARMRVASVLVGKVEGVAIIRRAYQRAESHFRTVPNCRLPLTRLTPSASCPLPRLGYDPRYSIVQRAPGASESLLSAVTSVAPMASAKATYAASNGMRLW
jgi:hypothetical protein